jgi:hypothetical protein
MRISTRRTTLSVLAGVLSVVLALPASAAQRISYEGTTTQDERVRLNVLKRDNGRRIVTNFTFRLTVACEDSSTEDLSFRVAQNKRLSDTGEFRFDFTSAEVFDAYALHIAGTVSFRSATGTVEFKYPNFTEAEEVQLCTSGVLDWSAERVGSEPARAQTGTSPEDMTRLRIDRHGELVEVAGG